MLPYPVLAVSLVLMWLLLNGFTLGHFILGSLIAVFASWAMASLRPEKPRFGKWYLLPQLVAVVSHDIVLSNLKVAWIILSIGKRKHNPGFVAIQLEISNPFALAVLAVVVTSTPGSAWLEYDSNQNTVLLHVLDVDNEAAWREMIKNRYERLLKEIFI